jgi:hypothetical protein
MIYQTKIDIMGIRNIYADNRSQIKEFFSKNGDYSLGDATLKEVAKIWVPALGYDYTDHNAARSVDKAVLRLDIGGITQTGEDGLEIRLEAYIAKDLSIKATPQTVPYLRSHISHLEDSVITNDGLIMFHTPASGLNIISPRLFDLFKNYDPSELEFKARRIIEETNAGFKALSNNPNIDTLENYATTFKETI